MPFKWVSASDLNRWADSTAAQRKLPLLLRRLVHGTLSSSDIEHINFPADEETHRPGYDGETKSKIGNAKVPQGATYWEMGANIDVVTKLNGDYDKRIKKRGHGDFSQATYVAVTPRDFQNKAEWAAQKNLLRQWREVRVYDSDDLEHWIELAPAVGSWLAGIILPHPPEDVCDLETRWKDLVASLRCELPPAALLAGRSAAIERISQWVDGPAQFLAITGHSPQEAVDVFTAWVASLSDPQQSSIASRAIIVDSSHGWNLLANFRQPLLLIAGYNLELDEQMVVRAIRNGHHVLHSVPTIGSQSVQRLKLERLDRLELEHILREAGLPEQGAVTLSKQSGGSFTIFKRRFSSIPTISRPEWSHDTVAVSLAPLLLAGAWNSNSSGDQQVITTLTGNDYASANSVMNSWRAKPDSPVRWINGTWEFVSPLDAWAFLQTSVTSAHLDRFETVACDVLAVDDPRLELPLHERWLANVRGKNLAHSWHLREGLTRTLALLGTTGDGENLADTVTLASRVNRVVSKILPPASSWKRWASIGSLLPLLAEAAPDVFLDSVEAGIRGECELAKLFTEEGEPMTGGSEHTGLLWALERLAWSAEYLPRTSLVLAKLAEKDPGGKLANRPKASLRDIFFSWMPHTAATLNERLSILALIKTKHPGVAWELLLSLLPNSTHSIMQHEPPQWRFWAEQWQRDVSDHEYALMISGTVQLLLDLLSVRPDNCLALLPHLNRLSEVDQAKIIDVLERLPTESNADIRRQLWVEVGEFTHRQRSFPDAQWALKGEPLRRLESIGESLRPHDSVQLALPLFKKGADRISGRRMTWQEQATLQAELRREAVQNVLTEKGIEAVVRMAETAELPWALGQAVFEASGEKYEDVIVPSLLGHSNRLVDEFAKTYVRFRLNEDRGNEWAHHQPIASWQPKQAAQFISQMQFDVRTWEFAAGFGGVIEKQYWEITDAYGTNLSSKELEVASKKLISIGRVRSSIYLIAISGDRSDFPASVQLDLLEAALAVTFTLENEKPIGSHDIHTVLERVQKDATVDHEKLARVEWLLIPLLDGPVFPTTLHRVLSESPTFFIEVLSAAYRPRNRDPSSSSNEDNAPAKKQQAERAWRLFREWKRPPGTRNDGTIDAEVLRAWVTEMRAKAAEGDRIEVADITLGEVFAWAPMDLDGRWPCAAVREIIEVIDAPEIGRGFTTGIVNKRGSYMKSLHEGGNQERELAAKYKTFSEKCRTQSPKTAKALFDVAHQYEQQAAFEDGEAERRW